MPIFKDKPSNQKSTSGILATAGEIQSNDNDNISYSELMKDYDNMRKGDPIISGLLEFLKLPILSADYRIDYDPESQIEKEIAEFLEWTFDNLNSNCGGFQSFKYHSLLAVDYGNSIFEYVWDFAKQWKGRTINQLIKLAPIQNYTINEYEFDSFMNLVKMKLWRYESDGKQSLIDLSKNKLFIHTHNQEFGDIRGRSILRPMRKFWTYKQAILDASTRATQRGAGLPWVQYEGSDASIEQKANQLGRTIGNMKNGYIASQKGSFDIAFIELKDQGNVIPLLEYYDKQTFYGTLSQFMMSGIGQNGSRSATSEHKSSYELMAGYILNELEERINYELIPKILQNSPYAYIDVSNIPYFRFNSISSIDVQKVAPNLVNLYNTKLVTKTPDDELFIREMFGLPEIQKEEVVKINEPAAQFEKCNHSQVTLDRKNPMREMNEFEKSVFNLESAVEHFETTQEKTDKLLQTFTKKIIDDMIEQFKRGQKTIEPRFQSELISKLKRIYDEGQSRGFRDVQIEVSKLSKKKDLALKQFAIKGDVTSFLKRAVKKYYSEVKFTFEDEIDFNFEELSADKKKADEIFTGIDEKFKNRKREIITNVQSSYNDGRKDALKEFNVTEYQYNAQLDDNVCSNCEPLDQSIVKADELKLKGLQLDSPVNRSCEGRSKCRCILIPYSLGGE